MDTDPRAEPGARIACRGKIRSGAANAKNGRTAGAMAWG
ncbi:hypothetical protein PLANPX_0055 [Lacipirellula parvula]|uniref:Uncharacterized protein n=1 Tax=Lacipirellula parvula TaxID=2650471 RepID=A0A5K7X7K4_9BACT|nr:hypothetical protein PLANPX_0055 [Lacipirellula parvula]